MWLDESRRFLPGPEPERVVAELRSLLEDRSCAPMLWRGEVQVLPGVGHAPHEEAPEALTAVLTRLVTEQAGE